MAKVTETKVKISLVDAMSDKLNTISSGLKEFGIDLGKISGNLGKFATMGTAVATGTAMIASALVKSGREVSAFSNQFISYTKDVKSATEMYNLFNETYRNTNYDEQQVYNMAKGFLNVGISAKDASELIMKCADTAAEMGQGVEMANMLADCFKRLASGGQLTEKQYKALAEAGIDLSSVQEEIRKGGEAGYNALSKSLEEYSGGMQRAKGTAAEMEGDIKGNLIEIGRQTALLIDDFFDFSGTLKAFYQWVIDVSSKVIQSIKDMRNALRENVASADAYGSAIRSFGEEYDRVKDAAEQGDKAAIERLRVMHEQASVMAQEAKDAEALKIKEEQIAALEAKRKQPKSIAKESGGGKVKVDTSEKDYERALTNVNKLIDDLNVKAVEATGNKYKISMAKLTAEVNGMNDVISKAAKEGIDTTLAAQAVKNYQNTQETKILEEKYQTEHELRLQDLENQLSVKALSTENYKQKLVEELTAHKAHLTTLLSDEKLSAEERMRLQTELAKATKDIIDNSTKDYKDAWKDALEEIKTTVCDQYATIKNGIVNIADQFTNFGQNLLTESKSLTDRINDLFKNLANSILNMMMKIYMQKILLKMIPGIGSLFGAADGGYIGAKAYASGGSASGWSLVGERGPELVNFDQPGRVYNAEQTAKALGSGGNVNIKIDLRNESGQQMEAETSGTSFDGEAYVVGVVLKAISSNKNGMRSVIQGVART